MELQQAVMTRSSVRSFSAEAIPANILRSLIAAGVQAPSWSNTQTWEFAVLGGPVLARIKDAYQEKSLAGVKPNSDLPFPTFTAPYSDRSKSNGRRFYEKMGIGREDKVARQEYLLSMNRFFDAPNLIILLKDESLSEWSLLDGGLALQNIVLSAYDQGLGTCILAAVAMYPDVIRAITGISEHKQIVCGIAVGYPLPNQPKNDFRSEREALNNFLTLYGIDE